MQNEVETFNQALDLFRKDFVHDDLIELLNAGNVIQKQFAALNLKCVVTKEEVKILLSNLVGVDGKIREVVALKLAEFTQKNQELFFQPELYEKFVQATIDIDGNVCRLAILSAYNLIENTRFAKFYTEGLFKIINEALKELSTFTFRDKKYKINKQIFKIYWALEGLIFFYQKADYCELKEIIKKCSELEEYTIREKCARLLTKICTDDELNSIKEKLSKDENYYVRNALNS